MSISKGLKSNIFLVLAAVIWGFAFVAQCDAAAKIDIFLLLAIRYLLGGISLIPIILLYENPSEAKMSIKPSRKRTILCGAVCGAILFLASLLQQTGINMNPNASKAGFITGTYTVMVPIFCFIIFRKKTGINVCLGAVCAVIGLYLLSVTDGFGSIAVSDLLLLGCAALFAVHIICIDKLISSLSAIKFSSVQFITTGLIALIIVFLKGNVDFNLASTQIKESAWQLIFMGVFSSGIAYTCQVLGQRDADPTYAAIILSAESVFAAVGGALFGTDGNMGLRKYIGCAVIFMGIILSQIKISNKK